MFPLWLSIYTAIGFYFDIDSSLDPKSYLARGRAFLEGGHVKECFLSIFNAEYFLSNSSQNHRRLLGFPSERREAPAILGISRLFLFILAGGFQLCRNLRYLTHYLTSEIIDRGLLSDFNRYFGHNMDINMGKWRAGSSCP